MLAAHDDDDDDDDDDDIVDKMFKRSKVHSVKWFRIFQCITDNSIKHQLFVYTQLNDQIVLFQTIRLGISHLFALSFNVKHYYLTHR